VAEVADLLTRNRRLWRKIGIEGMPDTSKRDRPPQVPAQQDRLRPRRADPSALARLFDEWMQGDEAEQKETFEVLRRSLDENRPAGYKLLS
jgi:hypothetical protein